MHVRRNVKNMQDIWNTASYVHKHVGAVLKNVEGWLDSIKPYQFFSRGKEKNEDAKRVAAFWAYDACCY
jgi:hypothetical protein